MKSFTDEQVRAVAQAIVHELGRQDYDDPHKMDDRMCVPYLDQGAVDMSLVAKAALAAMPDA